MVYTLLLIPEDKINQLVKFVKLYTQLLIYICQCLASVESDR